MKTYIQSIRISLITITLFGIICSSCSKSSNADAADTHNDSKNNNSAAYSFSTPVGVASFIYGYTIQRAFITPNHIYLRGDGAVFYKDNSSSMLNIDFPDVVGLSSPRVALGDALSFCIDKNDKFLYAIFYTNNSGFRLFKCDISSASTFQKAVAVPIASIYTKSVMKVLDNGDIVYSSDQNGGSIQILKSGSTTATPLASNLGGVPSAIDVYNNEIYFTLNSSNGSVQKISATGTTSTVIGNLTSPSRLAFDNNGNMIVETDTTIAGSGYYGKYAIYSNTGSKIAEIRDAQNKLILTALSNGSNGLSVNDMAPLCVDNYNNLLFGHSDIINSAYPISNYSNPFIDGQSDIIYKMQLIKK